MKIKNWKIKNSKGETFDFFNWQQNSRALLFFFRGKNCGICLKFLMKINENIEKLADSNIKPLAISNDEKTDAAVLSAFLKLKFENLPDPKLKLIEKFNVPTEKKNGKNYILPTLFLINPNHEIVWQRKSKRFDDIIGLEELLIDIRKTIKPK